MEYEERKRSCITIKYKEKCGNRMAGYEESQLSLIKIYGVKVFLCACVYFDT